MAKGAIGKSADNPNPVVPDVVIDITDDVLTGIDYFTRGNRAVQIVSGSEAFRNYSWIKNMPATNAVGNLRGMVVNSRARGIWSFSTNVAKQLSKYDTALALASLALEISRDSTKAVGILDSTDPWETKASRLSVMTSMCIFRALTGIVPAGAHLLAESVQGYLRLADVASGGRFQAIQQATTGIQAMDAEVSSTYSRIYSDDYIYTLINKYLVLPIPPI